MALDTDLAQVAHLLRRFGLGASRAEVEFYSQGGYRAAVDRLLDYENTDEGFSLELQDLANQQGNVNIRALQAHWLLRLVVTRRPLQEKLTLFWHDHFATSAQKVDSVPAMARHVQTLREHAIGGFQELTLAVAKDPAMLYWLDNNLNVKGKPNENFAREVMELFTLGIGHYTETDVREAARALTGWTYGIGPRARSVEKPVRQAEFVFREGQHDAGTKTILGRTGDWQGEDAVRIVCQHPQTSRHLVRKLWEWFVYPKPEDALVERIAAGWRQNDLSIRWLVRTIMLSPEFLSPTAERALYKNPIDFVVSTYRQLGIGQRVVEALKNAEPGKNLRALAPINPLGLSAKAMGMEVLYPPDVAGWEGGEAWISTATMVERIKWADKIFGAPSKGQIALRYPASTLFDEGASPEEGVGRLLEVFDADLPLAKRAQIVKAATELAAEAPSAQRVQAFAASATRLIFGSPEFQMN